MRLDYYIADVFTQQLFNGAQIAVFPKADGLSEKAMKLLARELNLSETVFVFRPDNNDMSTRRMRTFTPKKELDFAGHPVIATAFILGLCGDIDLTSAITSLRLEQNIGMIDTHISAEHGQPTFVQFTQKVTAIVDRFAPTDDEIAGILGVKQSELDHLRFSPRLVSAGFPYLIVPVWNYESVRNAKFNMAAWSQSIAPQTAAQEILLFAPKSPFADADFNVRLFGPNIAADEDPPVGSAMPAFASYLCSFEHTRLGTHVFAVDRGDAISRRSVINLEMDHKGQEVLTLRVGGNAVLFARGSIELPDAMA